ncbi:MAG: Protoheme farnesyltransferase [Verrucomicrobiota bacterium]|jgi:protoheme IX farnesyltransferase
MDLPLAPAAPPTDFVIGRSGWAGRAAAVVALTKPRLACMSVLTTMTAYTTARWTAGPAVAVFAGTALAAAGALSLNQWWERRTDAMMPRTSQRPLPLASISPSAALAWSLGFSVAGVVLLAACVNAAAALVAAATILLYGVVYTPLKRRTRWATEIGSISGALPALLGNAAAGSLGARPGLLLGAVLLLWQMPHFFAIGWRYREEYRAAGFPLLPVLDATGRRTAVWSFIYTVALIGVSLAPWALGWFSAWYGAPALVANGWLLRCAWQFCAAEGRDRAARALFLASIFHLPVLIAGLLLDAYVRG